MEAAAAGEVSSVLLAQELPEDVTKEMLGVLFGRFAGFEEIRTVDKRGVAFIEVRSFDLLGWRGGVCFASFLF